MSERSQVESGVDHTVRLRTQSSYIESDRTEQNEPYLVNGDGPSGHASVNFNGHSSMTGRVIEIVPISSSDTNMTLSSSLPVPGNDHFKWNGAGAAFYGGERCIPEFHNPFMGLESYYACEGHSVEDIIASFCGSSQTSTVPLDLSSKSSQRSSQVNSQVISSHEPQNGIASCQDDNDTDDLSQVIALNDNSDPIDLSQPAQPKIDDHVQQHTNDETILPQLVMENFQNLSNHQWKIPKDEHIQQPTNDEQITPQQHQGKKSQNGGSTKSSRKKNSSSSSRKNNNKRHSSDSPLLKMSSDSEENTTQKSDQQQDNQEQPSPKKRARNHSRGGKREEPSQCTYCNKWFCSSWSRLSHERTHTGQNRYYCKVCHRSFPTQHNHAKGAGAAGGSKNDSVATTTKASAAAKLSKTTGSTSRLEPKADSGQSGAKGDSGQAQANPISDQSEERANSGQSEAANDSFENQSAEATDITSQDGDNQSAAKDEEVVL